MKPLTQAQWGYITEFIFNDGTFFAAKLDNGGARVGMNAVTCFLVPNDHEMFEAALAATTASAVEEIFDYLMEKSCKLT